MPNRVPDFFIIGAPKCGTSALSEYLRTHPAIFFSRPKEPFFYSADYAHRGRISHRRDYLALFAEAPTGVLLGEGSTWYLRSEVAVPRILEDNPNARFIVMLREPVSMLRSLHAHQLREMDEDLEDFSIAWSFQSERAQGRQVPRLCSDPKMLHYRQVCSFGEQVERLLSIVPRSQVLIHVLEEFVADPKAGYHRTLAFLGLPRDGRSDFPALNQARDYRSRLMNRVAVHAKHRWSGPYVAMKVLTNRAGLRPGSWMTRSNRCSPPGRPLTPQFMASLRAELAPEIARLERALCRPIAAWHKAS